MTTAAIFRDTSKTVTPEQSRFSPEFELMLACLRWPFDDAALEDVAERSLAVKDWPHLLKIAARHRVFGLVWRALQQAHCDVPPAITRSFQQAVADAARQALYLSVESLRLARLLKDSGVSAIFLKGAVVSVLAYGDVTVRHAKDIDVIIPEAWVTNALATLRSAGYLPTLDLDTADPPRRTLWFHYAKSVDLQHKQTGVLLELHWRLTDLLLADVFTKGHQDIVIAPNRTLPALPPDELLAYLCVHGATHGWMRLKWLADVYALLQQSGDVQAAYERVEILGAGRSAGQALLLCHDLFGLAVPQELLQKLERGAVLRVLRRSPPHLYRRGNEESEVDDLPFGTTSVYVSRMLLSSGLVEFLGELRMWAYRSDHLLRTRLPHRLFFLFPLFRVGTWAKARWQHGGRSAPG